MLVYLICIAIELRFYLLIHFQYLEFRIWICSFVHRIGFGIQCAILVRMSIELEDTRLQILHLTSMTVPVSPSLNSGSFTFHLSSFTFIWILSFFLPGAPSISSQAVLAIFLVLSLPLQTTTTGIMLMGTNSVKNASSTKFLCDYNFGPCPKWGYTDLPPPFPPLSFAPIFMKDVQCSESNEKSIFRFFLFLFFELSWKFHQNWQFLVQ